MACTCGEFPQVDGIQYVHSVSCCLRCRDRFAFLNREDSKNIQHAANAAKYAEKTETSKIPKGAQVRLDAHRN